MSRIGNKPIPVPKGVEIKKEGNAVLVKGPKGSLTTPMVPGIEVKIENNVVAFARKDDEGKSRAAHGLMRALVANNVLGVTQGFSSLARALGRGAGGWLYGMSAAHTAPYLEGAGIVALAAAISASVVRAPRAGSTSGLSG